MTTTKTPRRPKPEDRSENVTSHACHILVVYDVSVWVAFRESDGKVNRYGGGRKVNYLARDVVSDILHS